VSPYANEAALTPEDEAPLDPNRELKPLTLENVDAALEEVRPYLRADGGDVEVVGIEDGIVAVRLQGACGSCTSSTATLKGGIERTLVRVFGAEAVREVVNLDGGENGAGALSLSREAVEAHLEKLAGAIHNYGGSVKVLDVEDGVCVLEFSGPLALAQSIASAIKGKFPLVKECKIKQV
jgi:Fe-S cluster biogenesis protein NfuA